jgi:hypothetical protein
MADWKALNKNSGHWKYFLAIRSLWGLKREPEFVSLCRYCQTMFWLSVLSVIAFPLIAAGWLIAKGYVCFIYLFDKIFPEDFVYRVGNNRTVQRINRNVGPALDNTAESPLVTYACVGVILLFMVTMVALILKILAIGIIALIQHLPEIPGYIWTGLLYVGHTVFWVLAVIGYGLTVAGDYIGWFFTNAEIWGRILFWGGIGAGATFGLASTTFLVYKSFQAGPLKWLKDWINNKIEAMAAERIRRRREREDLIEAANVEVIYGPAPPPPVQPLPVRIVFGAFRFIKNVCCAVGRAFRNFFFSREVTVADSVTKILSPAALIWGAIVSGKKAICPILKPVDMDELLEQQAAERAAEAGQQAEAEQQQDQEVAV